ncbi:MAG: response regulator receiver domain [Pseudomonadota bacterium]
MTIPDTLDSYSKHAAETFIQTAVFVDDRLYEKPPRDSDKPKFVVAPKRRKRSTKAVEVAEDRAPAGSGIEGDEDAMPDAYDIVNSFAKKQIVCSLYQPKPGASVSPSSDIFPLCKAADIVIVDWDLHGDDGERAVNLIDGLISQAVNDVPEQLRLILVYTQETNLFEVANKLYVRVLESLSDGFVPQIDDGGLAFHTDNSRVVVLGKPGRERPGTDPKSVVSEAELANTAIAEFARLASGLLHAASLLGLAKIRQNSRKILSKFNSELDPGFLTHLALSLPVEDASTHITPLLVSEIESVLEDVLPKPLMPKKLLEDWVDSAWEPGTHLEVIFNNKKGVDFGSVAKDLITKGFSEAREAESAIPNPKNGTKNTRKAAQILLPSADSTSNQHFSHLMASRTFYGDKLKALKLGSLVQHKENETYYLCIQPICDSVRLKDERVFVFVMLQNSAGGISDSASHVIFKADGTVQELIYDPKSYRCYTATFKPDRNAREVLAKKNQADTPVFVDTDGTEYVWIDQLKISHAQRAVEQFASDLSRVGLTESDWLRRLSGK